MIHVRLQNRILDDKTTIRAFLPILIWLVVLLATLFTMFATNYYILVPVMGLEFLCIIPAFLISKARVSRAFAALDLVSYEADLEVRDSKLYYGDIELKIKYDKKSGIVSLTHEKTGGKYHARVRSFWAIVCDEDKERFLEFCKVNHIKY